MRLYRVSCDKCGWEGQRMIEEPDVKAFQGHRCRACLTLDPASTQLFRVTEVVINLPSMGQGVRRNGN